MGKVRERSPKNLHVNVPSGYVSLDCPHCSGRIEIRSIDVKHAVLNWNINWIRTEVDLSNKVFNLIEERKNLQEQARAITIRADRHIRVLSAPIAKKARKAIVQLLTAMNEAEAMPLRGRRNTKVDGYDKS